MRSKIAQQMLDQMPEDLRIFTDKYADIIVRVHDLLEEKGLSQKSLAAKMGKQSSEISKWLSGSHNLTLRSIAKLEAELGEKILYVPQRVKARHQKEPSMHFTIIVNDRPSIEPQWERPKYQIKKSATNVS